jgi:hypothetical protein
MAGRGTASDGLPKLRTQVRFPSPALAQLPRHCAAPLAARHSGSGTWATLGHPRFIETAEELLGGPVIPECPVGVLYFSEAGWHNGDGIGVPGLISLPTSTLCLRTAVRLDEPSLRATRRPSLLDRVTADPLITVLWLGSEPEG